jgi:hypothetical protein
MTASDQEAKTTQQVAIPAQGVAIPAQRTADDKEAAPGSELSSQTATRGDVQETQPVTGSVATAPDDVRQLQLQIERTREQLGETVQELLARVDVKARARAMATEVSGKCKSTMVQARNQAAIRAGGVRDQVAGNTVAARQKAASAGRAGKDQVRGRIVAAGTPAWEAMPEQVRRTVTKGASGARERWMPLAVAAGVVIIGYLAIRQWKVRPSSPDPAE